MVFFTEILQVSLSCESDIVVFGLKTSQNMVFTTLRADKSLK